VWAQRIAGIDRERKGLLNVFEYEEEARKKLPPAHFGYLATGVDDDATLAANRAGFDRIKLRPRRLIDVSNPDLSVELFGERFSSPIGLSPVGSQKAFHPDGESAVARAVASAGSLQLLSTASTTSVEDVAKALGRPPWYQLYTTSRFDYAERIAKRAEGAGAKVLVLTVDVSAGRNTETQDRMARLDKRVCSSCHTPDRESYFRRKPMFDGLEMKGVRLTSPALDWRFVERLKKQTSMKLVIKGLVASADAKLAREHGADGIIVSNHGGRAEESRRSTIEALPEVIEAAGPNLPVLIDSGFRRGTDIYKALALGAKAVCVGRPYVWGLASFGQAGVEQVIEILRQELQLVMQQCGARSVRDIDRASVIVG
jgi:isopentenyl diphosphate isomerase/L-lactate dehydrogenase-like FMN-dependent dehydrogenase